MIWISSIQNLDNPDKLASVFFPDSVYIHSGSKKTKHQTLVHIFAKYWPIFKFFYRCIQQEIYNKAIYKHSTTP